MRIRLGAIFIFTGVFAWGPAHAQDAQACELHVWPTNDFYAVFHGATFGSIARGNPAGEVTPRDDAQNMLQEAAGGDFQRAAITEMNPSGLLGRFSAYRIVFHEPLSEPRYRNWIARDVGAGGRNAETPSSCYSELHVIFITQFRTALSKKIQTTFLFREFGASQTAVRLAVDAGSTGAPAFPPRSPEQAAQASQDLKAAFQQNLRIFLSNRRMRRILASPAN